MDITQIRLEKLRQFRDSLGPNGDTKLSELLDRSLSQIGQIIGPNPSRNIGNRLARDIEEKLNKPQGWLDRIDSEEDQHDIPAFSRSGASNSQAIDSDIDHIAIKRVDLKISAGISGFGVEYLNGERSPIFFRRDWIEKKGFNPDKLHAIAVSGESMEPSLYDGDLVVINTDEQKPVDGEVFAANYEGEVVIKRLIREAGQWFLSSDNPDKRRYPNKLCHEHCFIIGRIIYKQSERI